MYVSIGYTGKIAEIPYIDSYKAVLLCVKLLTLSSAILEVKGRKGLYLQSFLILLVSVW